MLEIVLTPKILRLPEIGGPRLKPFQPNGKSAPALGAWIVWKAISLKKCRKYNFVCPRHITVVINRCQASGNMLGLEQWLGYQPFLAHGPSLKKSDGPLCYSHTSTIRNCIARGSVNSRHVQSALNKCDLLNSLRTVAIIREAWVGMATQIFAWPPDKPLRILNNFPFKFVWLT